MKLVLILAAALVVVGCDQLEAADDLGDTRVLVERQSGSVEIEAPTWFEPETLVVLCPTAPIEEGDGLRPATLELADECRVYGRFDSTGGLTATLRLGELDAARFAAFDAAPEWWLVLVAIHGESPGAVYRTVVEGGPIDPSVTPGPPESLAAPDPSATDST